MGRNWEVLGFPRFSALWEAHSWVVEEARACLGSLSLPGSLLSANWQWPSSQWPCLLQPHRQADGLNPGLQTCRPAYSMPWACPESSTGLHLAVIGLDAYLQYESLWCPN